MRGVGLGERKMWNQLWALSVHSDGWTNVFLAAFIVFFFKVVMKFITKLPVICNIPPDPAAKRAAYFDCLRIGLDAGYLGLIASFGVLRLALKDAQHDRVPAIADFQFPFLIMQFTLVLLAAIFTAVFRSPDRNFAWGIGVPSVFGFFSVWGGIAIYVILSK